MNDGQANETYEQIFDKNPNELDFTIWINTSLLVLEKILFFLTIIKLEEGDGEPTKLDYYKKINGKFEPVNYKKKLIYSHYFFKQFVTFDEYNLFENFDNDFINITYNISKFETLVVYNDVSFNFNANYLKKLLVEHLRPEDLNNCLVAGGHFSNYIFENPISKNFPSLFKSFKSLSDVDVYIPIHYNFNCYKYYTKKFAKKNLLIPSSNLLNNEINNGYKNIYQFSCIKFKHESTIVNLIFNKEPNFSTLDFIYLFDLDLSKIIYSFKFDNFFVHYTFIKRFHSIILNNCLIKDLSLYENILENKKALFLESDDYLVFETEFIRFLKYCFKGYINSSSHYKHCFELIEFYLKRYESQLKLNNYFK